LNGFADHIDEDIKAAVPHSFCQARISIQNELTLAYAT
jgi:hypothetical protein